MESRSCSVGLTLEKGRVELENEWQNGLRRTGTTRRHAIDV